MKIKFLSATALIIALAIGSTNAQTVDNAKTQNRRIKEGVKSGELTKGEAANLRKDQKEIRKTMKEAQKDGFLSKEEKRGIRHGKRHESRKIAHLKHNDRVRH